MSRLSGMTEMRLPGCWQTTMPFDLALLDIMLPGLDGFGLLGPMKARGIPVIYLTARTDLSSKVKGADRRRGGLHRKAL